MQLQLMLNIFACDAWLALLIFFEKFCSKILPRLKQFSKQRFINKQNVEKEFFIHIIEICCNSGMLVKSCRFFVIKLAILRRIHYLPKWFVFELWFPSDIISAHLYVAMTSLQTECAINENYRNLLRNLIVGIIGKNYCYLEKIMFSIWVRCPTYPFLFPFSIYEHCSVHLLLALNSDPVDKWLPVSTFNGLKVDYQR